MEQILPNANPERRSSSANHKKRKIRKIGQTTNKKTILVEQLQWLQRIFTTDGQEKFIKIPAHVADTAREILERAYPKGWRDKTYREKTNEALVYKNARKRLKELSGQNKALPKPNRRKLDEIKEQVAKEFKGKLRIKSSNTFIDRLYRK